MRDDINLLNLMNGMNYSASQLSALAEIARKSSAMRHPDDAFAQCGKAPADPAAAERYRGILREIVERLASGEGADEGKLQAAWKARRLAGIARSAPAGQEAAREMERIAQEARKTLTAGQCRVLADYTPCLIPPRNLKDPVRVGQASDHTQALRHLQNLRGMQEGRWQEKRDDVVERTLTRIEEAHGRYPPAVREEKKLALDALLSRARSLSDVDFELAKGEIGKELEQFSRKDELKKELETLLGEDDIVDQKVRSFLLHPRAAALYEARLARLAEGPASKPVDLDTIRPADSCKDGHCAIDE